MGAVDDGDESFPLAPTAAVDAGTVNSVNSAAKPVATIAQLADYLINGFWQYNSTFAHHWGSSTISYDISGLNANEQMLAQSALNAWHEVANLTFVQTSGAANITFTHNGTMTAYEYDYYSGSGIISSAFVNISADWITNDGGAYDGRTGIDSYGYQTYVHEIGHALGLGHQGPYNGSASYSTDAIYADDTWQYSVMSYFPQNSYSGSYRYVVTPQMADIYAVNAIYGAATTRAGDTVYGFHNTAGSIFDFNNYTQAPALTIYDSGGNDTLDCSGYSTAQTINLHAGSFCSVGGLINNIGIALNAIIETAIGGSGNDTLIANDVGNRLYGGSGIDSLYGGSGNDSLTGGIGNDSIDGGGGTDIAVFAGLRSAYQVTILSSGAVQVSGSDGVDMLVNVEALTFDDQTVTIAPNNPPATPTPHNQTMASGTSVALSTLFTGLTDADAWDSVTHVWVSDRTAGNGHLTFNGVVQNDNQAFGPIPIGQLSQWAFLAGGTDTIAFQTVDIRGAFSATAFATVTASAPAPNNPPATPTPHNQTVASGTSVALSTLFTGLTDPDSGDSVTQVWVSDRSAGGGHLTFNGVVQNDNQAFGPIPIGQLSQWAFLAGGTDNIAFQTVDTHGAFSATAFATVTASAPAPNNPPATPIPHNQTVASGTSVALSTLFTGLTDPDSGDSVTQVWVSDRSAGGGHLTFNGVVQNDNQAFGPIPIGQLGQWAFLAGGNDTIAFQTVDTHGTFSATAFATVNVSANTPISNGTVHSETGNTIAGSSANDVMVGGGGSDTFVFAPNFGRDTISNFESGKDIIQIDRSVFADAAAVFSHAAEDGRGSVVIAHDEGNTITLQNLTLAGLHAGDFHLI